MPSRYYRRLYSQGYYYHIYNRGVNKSNVFLDKEDYENFIDILSYYLTFPQGKPLSLVSQSGRMEELNKVRNLILKPVDSSIELYTYCLMPNHFHLLIKQSLVPTQENNISNLMRRLTITYAMYAKEKYERSGALFEGKFKNVIVQSDKQLLQLTKYIHRNPKELIGSEPLDRYVYSSYLSYINTQQKPVWLETKDILAFFSVNNSRLSYKNFVEESEPEFEAIEKIVLD